jgi:Ser/Thr protein kinase RdoA (MazF antagonist)
MLFNIISSNNQNIRPMHTFPVTDSTLSAIHLGWFVQEKYGLSAATTCKLFRTGINHSYIITDGHKKFVFRVYSLDWRSELEISEEIRLLNLLKEHNISISYPIIDRQQNYIQKIQAPEGLRFGVLFSYADGKKIRNIAKETLYHMGVLMAGFHKVTAHVQLKRTDYDAHSLTTLPYQFAKQHFPETNEEMCFIRQAGEVIHHMFTHANAEELRKGVVHLDMWYDNMHINGEADMTLFDFDFCGNGWLLHDIAYFIMQLFHTEPDKQAYRLKLETFFAGYEAVTKISEEEKRLLPYAGLSIWIFYLGVQSQRFDNWSNIFLSENYLKRYISMVKEWLHYNEIAL